MHVLCQDIYWDGSQAYQTLLDTLIEVEKVNRVAPHKQVGHHQNKPNILHMIYT